MFKCKECNRTYDIKPDYCDCGNDDFETIQNIVSDVQNMAQIKRKRTFLEQYPEIRSFLESLDVFSVIIFVLCLLLSVLALVFIKPNIPNSAENLHNLPKTTKNIPNIETIWTESLSTADNIKDEKKVVQKVTVREEGVPSNSKPAKTKTEQKTQVIKKTENVKQTVKTQSNSQKKELNSDRQKKTQVAHPAKTENDVKHTESVKKVSYDVEFDNYKVALRQALFNNLAVTSVVGSGDCVISFSIDKNGKLIEREFIKQSLNETVNQAVYNMMMKLPHYYPPPESYNGHKIQLSFTFDNGSYSIKYLK